jgi:uncharacterized protein YerC
MHCQLFLGSRHVQNIQLKPIQQSAITISKLHNVYCLVTDIFKVLSVATVETSVAVIVMLWQIFSYLYI